MGAAIKIAILANASNAVRGLRETGAAADTAGKKAGGLSKKFGGLKSMLAGGLALGGVAALGDVLKDGVAEAGAYQDAANATTAALKTNAKLHGLTAAQVQKSSASLESLTGAKVDENAATLAANKLIRAGVGSQAELDRALKVSADVALGSGKDIGSVSTALSKALANPAKAAGALGKAGVVLSATQKAAVDAMVKTGNTAGAQSLIMGALETKYQGASEAAGTGLTADMGRAQDAMADAKRDITTALLPTLSTLATSFAKYLPGAIAKVTPVLNGLVSLVTNPAFLTFAGVIGSLVIGFKAYSGVMTVVSAVTKTWTAVQAALNFVMALNPIGLIVIAVIALVAIFVVAYKKSETFRRIVNGALNGVKNAALAVVNFFAELPAKIGAVFTGAVTWLKNVGQDVMRGLSDGIEAGLQWVRDKVSGLGSLIPDWLKSVLGIHSPSKVLRKIGQQTIDGFAEGFASVSGKSLVNALASDLTRVTPSIGAVTLGTGTVRVGSEPFVSGRSGTGAGVVNINVSVPATVDVAEVGRNVVTAVEAYQRRTGRVFLVGAS